MPAPKSEAAPALVWFRRDLRLADNPALAAAARGGAVVPVFVLDPADMPGGASAWWLHGSLAALAAVSPVRCAAGPRRGDPRA